jgi:hypothetical protein
VKYWTIADEPHDALKMNSWMRDCWSSAAEYSQWYKAGYRAIKSIDAEAQVILNAHESFAADVLEYIPASEIDVFSDNAYHVPQILERFSKLAAGRGIRRLWAQGVGVSSVSYYRDHLLREESAGLPDEHWMDNNRILAQAVIQTLGMGFERLFHYTASYVGNTNYYSLFEADSGLKPVGIQFGALIWLLDGIKTAREIKNGPPGEPLKMYRFDRKDGYTVFAMWASESRRWRLRLQNPDAQGVNLYDSYANYLPAGRSQQRIEFDMGASPVFLKIKTAHAHDLEHALRSLSVVQKRLVRHDAVSSSPGQRSLMSAVAAMQRTRSPMR